MSRSIRDFSSIDDLLGTWVNTDKHTAWFTAITLERQDEGYRIRPQGASGSHEWGQYALDGFNFKAGETGFHATVCLENIRADLTAYTNKGLIVLASYFDFSDRPHGSFLCRDFFVPQPDSWGGVS